MIVRWNHNWVPIESAVEYEHLKIHTHYYKGELVVINNCYHRSFGCFKVIENLRWDDSIEDLEYFIEGEWFRYNQIASPSDAAIKAALVGLIKRPD